jgi:hypothetical protein
MRKISGDAREIFSLHEHLFYDPENLLPWFRQSEKTLTVADEDLDAQLFLEVSDVLADARLRRKQNVRCFRQIKAMPHGFPDNPELLKVHS